QGDLPRLLSSAPRSRGIEKSARPAAECLGRRAGRAAGRRRVLRVRWLVLRATARSLVGHPRQEARQRRVDRRRLRRGLRRGLSDADGRRALAPPLACARPPSRPDPRGRGHAMTEPMLQAPFQERAATALKDRFLQEALTIATTKFIDLRKDAF